MTLYLYRIGTEVPILTIENVQNYTADSVTAKNAEGNPIIYSPLAADCQGSSAMPKARSPPCGSVRSPPTPCRA